MEPLKRFKPNSDRLKRPSRVNFVATFRSESWTIAVGTLYKFEVL